MKRAEIYARDRTESGKTSSESMGRRRTGDSENPKQNTWLLDFQTRGQQKLKRHAKKGGNMRKSSRGLKLLREASVIFLLRETSTTVPNLEKAWRISFSVTERGRLD
jgi:hypothetical protein